ncbi:MAG: carboxylesterase family protein [Bryobacteraceae bacterium]|nr:carboxylesterase family protein [Bryobacteraceae bacterium]
MLFENCLPALSRRQWLAHSLAMSSWPGTIQQPAAPGDGETVTVEAACGRLRGFRRNGVVLFRGVPYAGPVAGRNRFRKAPPLEPWTGVRDALWFGPPCPQPGRSGPRGEEPAPDENCLYLNIWTPAADRRRRPVMVYSHGGGFTTGSGGSPWQDATGLAREWDVVVVATNHRLGLLGFLYLGELAGEESTTSGNQGLLDICDALKWVHDNIEAFGGDPRNVMIFGESGGGAKTSCLYAMPAAAPYFHKASIESGPGIRMMPPEAAAETTRMVLRELGLEKHEWRRLLDVPVEKLLEVQAALAKAPQGGPLTRMGGRRGIAGNPRPGGFGPVVDGRFLPHHPFDPAAPGISKKKPLIVGYNRDETIFFFMQQKNTEVFQLTEETLRQRLADELGSHAGAVYETYRRSRPGAPPADLYIAITSALMFGIGSVTIAERKAAQGGAPVYMYVFTHESEALVPGTRHKVGAAHALEIPYKFYLLPEPGRAATGSWNSITRPESIATARNMSQMWASFARTGRPAAQGQPAWPPYTLDRRATMEINAQCRVLYDPWREERLLWEKLEL